MDEFEELILALGKYLKSKTMQRIKELEKENESLKKQLEFVQLVDLIKGENKEKNN